MGTNVAPRSVFNSIFVILETQRPTNLDRQEINHPSSRIRHHRCFHISTQPVRSANRTTLGLCPSVLFSSSHDGRSDSSIRVWISYEQSLCHVLSHQEQADFSDYENIVFTEARSPISCWSCKNNTHSACTPRLTIFPLIDGYGHDSSITNMLLFVAVHHDLSRYKEVLALTA